MGPRGMQNDLIGLWKKTRWGNRALTLVQCLGTNMAKYTVADAPWMDGR